MKELVKVCLLFSDLTFGTPDDQEAILTLEERLSDPVESTGVGDNYGNQFGKRRGEIYFCRPSADALLTVMRPILAASSLAAVPLKQTSASTSDRCNYLLQGNYGYISACHPFVSRMTIAAVFAVPKIGK